MEAITLYTEKLTGFDEEQFFQFCIQNQELKFERDKNQNIIIMSPTGTLTGNYNFKIIRILGNWNELNNLGYCFDSSTGFTLPNKAMRSPDAAWIAKKRWENIPLNDKERFAHICPDFIIELKSKTDSLTTLQNKMQEWLENGCRLGWLIDFENKTVYVYKPNHEVSVINSFKNPISGEDVLIGFELNLNEILN